MTEAPSAHRTGGDVVEHAAVDLPGLLGAEAPDAAVAVAADGVLADEAQQAFLGDGAGRFERRDRVRVIATQQEPDLKDSLQKFHFAFAHNP